MIFSSLLFAMSMSASSNVGPDPVRLLFLDASSCKFVIMQETLSTHSPAENAQFDSDRAKARADMEKHAPAAISSAGQSVDLHDAIEAFYDSAVAYCANPSSAADDDYKVKKRALDNKLTSIGR